MQEEALDDRDEADETDRDDDDVEDEKKEEGVVSFCDARDEDVGENVGEGVGEEEDDNTSFSHSSVTSNRGGEMFNVPSPHKLTDDGVDPKPKTIPDGVSVRSKAGTCVPAVFVVTSFDGVAARPDVVDVFFCKATRRSTLERPTFFADEKSGGRVLSPAIRLRVDALPRGVENCS